MISFKAKIALVLLAAASPALAGEITGRGKPTPVDGGVARSICSFSGLNDDAEPTPDIVQSYGMLVRAFGVGGGFPSPGIACRGN